VNPSHETHTGSFVFGIMAAILSTPCTAPFMGAAAAWAATKTPALVLITFAAIGSGMALPYLVLAASPRLIERMPRTGPASELIKQVMSLLMLAAAAYFVGVGLSGWMTKAPDPPGRMYWWAVSGFGIAAGAWLAHRTFRITRRPLRRLSWGGFGALIVLISASIGVRMTDSGPVAWTYYTAERFAAAKGQGDVVVMEFTAEWCLNCKALEESVLRSPRVVALLNGPGVEPIKVDLTGNNTAGNQMLREVQRLTIPLLVVFRPDGREVFKADFYTADQVLQAVERARSGSVE
jgi:thiol:disulfide interchange protein DsbD